MFIWDEPQAKAKPAAKPRMLPRIPSTGWQTPMDFPNLSGCKVLSIDTESFDPYLLTEGAGWARGKSHMVGASIATADKAWYFPIRHEICPEQNMPVEGVLRFLKDVLETPNVHKVGVNLTYDIGMLQAEGVHVKGVLHDVGYGEALLEERGRTSLDALATKYLKLHKETSLLYQWSHEAYGGDPSDQRANIYRCPPSLVGHYAEADARLPLQVFYPIWERLNAENLADLYRLECDLIPLYVAMRYAGVRVDLGEAERLHYELGEAIKVQRTQVFQVAGSEINVDSALDLAKSFDSLGFKYPRTPKDAPSFTKEFLQASECPLAAEVLELRKLQKLQGTFVGKILNVNVGGRLFPAHHPLRGDSGGTRSGRFSCSGDINTQQIPSRDKVWAKRLRGLFIPDDGHIGVRKYDYQAVEYRVLAHFAVGEGADSVRNQYIADPTTDYHSIVMDMIAPAAGWDVSTPELRAERRKPLKNINFGCIAEGQMVMTDKGNVPIQHVTKSHLVWDGVAFSMHDGVVNSGVKEVINYDGVTATRNHPVWNEGHSDRSIPFSTKTADGSRAKRAFSADNGSWDRYANDFVDRLLRKGEVSYSAGYSCYSSVLGLREDKNLRLLQPKAWSSLQVSGEHKEQKSSTKMVEEPSNTVSSYRATVSQDNTRIRSQLPWKRHRVSLYIRSALYNMGIGNVPEWGIHGDGHRQNKQRWSLFTGQFAGGYTVGKFTEQVTYDILNVGTSHRFSVNGVLVHNSIYGMGKDKMARSLGIPVAEADTLLSHYHAELPYVRKTMKMFSDMAERDGYITTLLGRRSRFDLYEPKDGHGDALPFRAALAAYGHGNCRLAKLHKATNRAIQGCKPASSRIWASDGLPTIGECVDKKVNVWTGFNWANATVVPMGKWQMAKVWLSTGEVIECDTRHKFKCDNSSDWLTFDELMVGTPVALPALGTEEVWDGTVDEWFTLGYWLGDGWQGECNSYDKRRDSYYTRESGMLVAAETKRERLTQVYDFLISKGVNVHWEEKDRSHEGRSQLNWVVKWSAKSACDYFRRIGVTNTTSKTKRIPERVWCATKQQQAAFLEGYLYTDGSRIRAAQGSVTIHSPNTELLREVQQLAHFLGREAVFRKASSTGSILAVGAPRKYPHKILQEDFAAKGSPISYIVNGANRGIVAKRAVTNKSDTWQTNANRVYAEQAFGLTPYRFAYVTQISVIDDVQETYTLSVEDERHQYIADGFITKNSSADILKKALHTCWTTGVFNEVGLPRLLVHDEILISDTGLVAPSAWKEMQHIFETSIPLRVPLMFEPEFGADWGHCKAI